MFASVMPYLSLADISRFNTSAPRYERIVQEYLRKGGNLTIDCHVLQEYPVQTNLDLYGKFSNTSAMTLKRIREDDIPQLMAIFPRIQSLTLLDMLILDNVRALPQSLIDLTLLRVQIEDVLFRELLSNNKDTLKSLEVTDIATCWCDSTVDQFDLEELCPNVRSLVIRGQSTEMRSDPSLRSASDFVDSSWFRFPDGLESLHYDVPLLCPPLRELTFLKSLTLRTWEGLRLPQALKKLNILKAVDYESKKDIAGMHIRSVSVVYFNEPVNVQPTPNLILNLNDDCLLLVLGCLSRPDCLSMAMSHPRIRKLVATRVITSFEGWSEENTENMDFWKLAAPFLKVFHADGLSSDELLWILPYCTGLTKLSLGGDILTKVYLETFSTQLKRNLDQLHILRYLSVDSSLQLDCLLDLLHRNRDTLEGFSFDVIEAEHWVQYQSIWEVIGGMPGISRIAIGDVCETGTELDLDIILSLVGKNLRSLSLVVSHGSEIEILRDTYVPQLQELTLDLLLEEELLPVDLEDISSLNNLKKLTLCGIGISDEVNENDFLEMIKSLPHLEHFDFDLYRKFSLRFGLALREYLQKEGRSLCVKLRGS